MLISSVLVQVLRNHQSALTVPHSLIVRCSCQVYCASSTLKVAIPVLLANTTTENTQIYSMLLLFPSLKALSVLPNFSALCSSSPFSAPPPLVLGASRLTKTHQFHAKLYRAFLGPLDAWFTDDGDESCLTTSTVLRVNTTHS